MPYLGDTVRCSLETCAEPLGNMMYPRIQCRSRPTRVASRSRTHRKPDSV